MHSKIALIGLGVLALVIIAGCAFGPKRVVYNTLAGVEITVDQAMQLWGDYVKQSHPTVAQEQAVEDAYEKYQLAEEEAIDAARFAIAVSGNADAETKRAAAAARASQSFADLLGLLRKSGVKV